MHNRRRLGIHYLNSHRKVVVVEMAFFLRLLTAFFRLFPYRPMMRNDLLIVHNQQHRMEWIIRYHMLRAWWYSARYRLIIIDCCSEDETVRVIASLAKQYVFQYSVAENMADCERLIAQYRQNCIGRSILYYYNY